MNSVDNCYLKLAEAVVLQAREEYVNACKNIIAITPAGKGNHTLSVYISRYHSCKRFFLTRCNGMVGINGEELLSSLNSRHGIDGALIEEKIAAVSQSLWEESKSEKRLKDF